MKINIDDLIDITNEEENIYQKLAKATARAVDINLGKTTLADLLDGYTKYRILKQEIKSILYNDNYCHIEKLQIINDIIGDKE